ncbi:MAG: hypothetical protein ABFQ65_03215 [Nanoarchaeota archaeon]
MVRRKRTKKNRHEKMHKKLIRGKKPMGIEQKNERKKLIEDSKKRQEEIDRKGK